MQPFWVKYIFRAGGGLVVGGRLEWDLWGWQAHDYFAGGCGRSYGPDSVSHAITNRCRSPIFTNHAIMRYGSTGEKYYDPSYGNYYSGLLYWQAGALHALAYQSGSHYNIKSAAGLSQSVQPAEDDWNH